MVCSSPIWPRYRQRSRARNTAFRTASSGNTKVTIYRYFRSPALSYGYIILDSFFVKTYIENEVSSHSDKLSGTPARSGGQAVEKPLESSRGPEPSRTTIVPGGVNGGDGRIFAAENSIFQSKNRFFAVFAAGIRRIQAKTGEGGREAENPLGFQVSPLAKLPTAQIVDLRRGTWPGSLLPRPPACQNLF